MACEFIEAMHPYLCLCFLMELFKIWHSTSPFFGNSSYCSNSFVPFLLDLDYAEDSTAETDANFVMVADGGIVEIQATAEERPFLETSFDDMLALAKKGVSELISIQKTAVGL